LQAGVARLQKPLIFSPLPNGAGAVGEGAGGGAKATACKGSSIAVELPDARLNNDRTFSFLDDVRQHMASPLKNQRISKYQNHLHGKSNANSTLL